jgi:hypothetical protein
VRAIRFSGSVSTTASRFLLHRNVFISFLVVPFLPRVGFVYFPVDVQGTARHTSSYTDCSPRLRATHHEWVWSHRCFGHGSLRRVHLCSQIC